MSFAPRDGKRLLDEVLSALAPVLEKNGLAATGQVSGVNPRDISLSVYLSREDSPEDRRQFEALADAYGLRADDYGAVFPWDDRSWCLVGINPRAKARPLEVRGIPHGVSSRLPPEAAWAVVQARRN